jgi:hypothetical protein
MPHFDKHFTLAEANSMLTRIREIFERIQTLLGEARENLKPPLESPEKLTPGRSNGKQHKPHSFYTREEITQEINDLITEITDQGIVIQDIHRGLVDFPAYIHGEEVFLCFEIDDGENIKYWHGIEVGYAGRQPIPDDLE